jgi:hypothetical protein
MLSLAGLIHSGIQYYMLSPFRTLDVAEPDFFVFAFLGRSTS